MKSTYNVIEAACKLGIKKVSFVPNVLVWPTETHCNQVIIASSETTYGVCFTQGESDYDSFPIEEDYDNNPEDVYACSKLCGERMARSFARRFKVDIYALRISHVTEPHEYVNFPGYAVNPASRKRNAWSYIDARDLGQICDLGIKTSGLGFQVFNAVNDTITLRGVKTTEFLKKMCPNVPITREMGDIEAPMSNRKAREMLGFKENHDWKKYVPEK